MVMTSHSLQLKSGSLLPKVGFGLWKVAPTAAPMMVQEAASTGYRHFDCACDYGNEREVGVGFRRVISQQICRREELWVTSKLWNTYHRREHVRAACIKSLTDLGLDYLDLYLIHFPIAQKYVAPETRYPPGWLFDPESESPRMELDRVPLMETWQEMEALVREGLVRHIGLCNVGTAMLSDLLSYATIHPEVLQVESHPYLVQAKLLRFCQEEQIAFTAFSPLGAPSYVSLGMATAADSVLEHPVIQNIASEVNRTPAQVVLRWGVQRETSVIPKTSRVERLKENLDLFNFSLTDQQLAQIGSLDRHQRFNDPGVFCEAAFNTFCPIYE